MATETMAPLSKREAEVLGYIAKGFSNKRIALILDISQQTVKNHIYSIMSKTKADNRTNAVLLMKSPDAH